MPRMHRTRGSGIATAIAIAIALPAWASQVELISKADPGLLSDTGADGTGTLLSFTRPSVSADGRYTAFVSSAPNLAAGQNDTNLDADVFLHDRVAGTTVLVSRVDGTSATAGNGVSWSPAVSADGSYVAFSSSSSNLVAGQADFNGVNEIFLFDRVAGTVTLVSHAAGLPGAGNGSSDSPRLSGDGRYMVFQSHATNLVSGQSDANGRADVFLYDRVSGTTTLLSGAAGSAAQTGNAGSFGQDLSADGSWIVFVSEATNLISGVTDTNLHGDVFLYGGGTLTLVSHASGSATTAGNGMTLDARISADGGQIAFASFSNDLVAGQVDAFNSVDLFLHDRASGTTALVSHAAGSALTAAGGVGTQQSEASTDGGWIAFVSSGTNLVPGQVDTTSPPSDDVFLFERATGTVTLVSHAGGSAVTAGNMRSTVPQISADGAWVAFASLATDLVSGQTEGNGDLDAFLYDRAAGTTAVVSHAAGLPAATGNGFSPLPALSGDAGTIAFYSAATDLVTGTLDVNRAADLFLYDRAAATNTLVSRRDPGLPSLSPSGTSRVSAVSADGRFVTFVSDAIHLVPGQVDTNPGGDLFLYDRQTGTTTLVSHAAGSPSTAANGESYGGAMSADGRYILLISYATNLVAGQIDTNAGTFFGFDVFLYDRVAGTTTLVSHAAGSPVTAGNGRCESAAISADGAFIAFDSRATDLVAGVTDANANSDVFLYDRAGGTTTLVSHAAGAPATTGMFRSEFPTFSGDGQFLVFQSLATNLVAGQTDTNSDVDAFLHERATGTTTLISHAGGSATTTANRGTFGILPSHDAAWIVLGSPATNLVAGQIDGNASGDVFLFERATGAITLLSHVPGSPVTAGNGGSFLTSISAGASRIVLSGSATDLVTGMSDVNGSSLAATDVFLHDRMTGATTLVSHARSSALQTGNGGSNSGTVSADGSYVVYDSSASNLVTGAADDNFTADAFLYDVPTGASRIVSRTFVSPLRAANRNSADFRISADGTTIAFESLGSDLVNSDFNNLPDVFVYRMGQPGRFYTVAACRLLDTRGPALFSGVTRIVSLHGACGIPETARTIALNATVIQPTEAGYLALYPGDLAIPATSTLNFAAGQTRANNAVLPLAANGAGTLAITPFMAGDGTVHLIVDVVGYFE